MSAVETYKKQDAATESAGDPNELVRFAIERGVDVEMLERLVALQERVVARNAEMAMAEALAGFQADCPPIPRTRTADVRKDGRKLYEYSFAPLEQIARIIRPHLAKHGLSYSHDAEIGDRTVKTTCTLQHIDGAKRTATFTGPFDGSGGKNPLQAVGSARSYGRRYSLLDVLGLTTEEDDDGSAAHRSVPELITDSQAATLEALLDEVAQDRGPFFRWAGCTSLEDFPMAKLAEAIRLLEAKR